MDFRTLSFVHPPAMIVVRRPLERAGHEQWGKVRNDHASADIVEAPASSRRRGGRPDYTGFGLCEAADGPGTGALLLPVQARKLRMYRRQRRAVAAGRSKRLVPENLKGGNQPRADKQFPADFEC